MIRNYDYKAAHVIMWITKNSQAKYYSDVNKRSSDVSAAHAT